LRDKRPFVNFLTPSIRLVLWLRHADIFSKCAHRLAAIRLSTWINYTLIVLVLKMVWYNLSMRLHIWCVSKLAKSDC